MLSIITETMNNMALDGAAMYVGVPLLFFSNHCDYRHVKHLQQIVPTTGCGQLSR